MVGDHERRRRGGSRCDSGAVPPLSPACHGPGARNSGRRLSLRPGARTPRGARVFLLLSTSDTDLLSARASGSGWRLANPARTTVDDLPALLDGADLVVVRLLGGRRAWEEGLDALLG